MITFSITRYEIYAQKFLINDLFYEKIIDKNYPVFLMCIFNKF